VDELRRLALDCIHYAWMAMASRHNSNAGREIQKPVTVNVFDDCAFTPARNERVTASVGRGYNPAIPLDNGSRAGTR
jgi:hypothetical protein